MISKDPCSSNMQKRQKRLQQELERGLQRPMEEGRRAFQAREECEEWFANSSIHGFLVDAHMTPTWFST